MRSPSPSGGSAMRGLCESNYWDELEFESWYGAHTMRELHEAADSAELNKLIKHLEIERRQEAQRTENIVSQLPDIINRLMDIPQVHIDGTIGVYCHMLVVRVDLPTRYTRYFVRSDNLVGATSERESTPNMTYFREAASHLLHQLVAFIPRAYICIAGNGYSHVTRHNEIELIAENRGYGPPLWSTILPAVQATYLMSDIKVRNGLGAGEWEKPPIVRPRRGSDKYDEYYSRSNHLSLSRRASALERRQAEKYDWRVGQLASELTNNYSSASSIPKVSTTKYPTGSANSSKIQAENHGMGCTAQSRRASSILRERPIASPAGAPEARRYSLLLNVDDFSDRRRYSTTSGFDVSQRRSSLVATRENNRVHHSMVI